MVWRLPDCQAEQPDFEPCLRRASLVVSERGGSMQRISRQRIGYLLDRRIPPVAVLRDGETVLVETEDSRTGRARLPEHTTQEWLAGLHQPGPYYSNPVTGPLLIEGAEPGDTLAVTIDEIVCDSQGYTGFWPASVHFPEWFPEPQTT